MIRTTLITAPNLADVLVVIPEVITTNTAIVTLDEDAAASSLITLTISSQSAPTKEILLVMICLKELE
jgi:hypothetical protein